MLAAVDREDVGKDLAPTDLDVLTVGLAGDLDATHALIASGVKRWCFIGFLPVAGHLGSWNAATKSRVIDMVQKVQVDHVDALLGGLHALDEAAYVLKQAVLVRCFQRHRQR